MSPEACEALGGLAPRLLAQLGSEPPFRLAVAGPPGSGKSTIAGMLAHLLNDSGTPAIALSLDDYYLSSNDRANLARVRHPLLQRRGVPGTHDWSRLMNDCDILSTQDAVGMRLPVFDKSRDDLSPAGCWRTVGFIPSCVIIEGWCAGAPGQDPERLDDPVNELERVEDPHAVWRSYVNDRLRLYRNDLVSRVDQFWYLEIPGWEQVVDWRWQQEQELAQPRLGSRVQTEAFLATFERIVRHMQETCAVWADFRLRADMLHCWQVVE